MVKLLSVERKNTSMSKYGPKLGIITHICPNLGPNAKKGMNKFIKKLTYTKWPAFVTPKQLCPGHNPG